MIKETILAIILTFAPPSVLMMVPNAAFQGPDDEVMVGISIKNPYNVPVHFRVQDVDGNLVNKTLPAGREGIYKKYNHIWIYSEKGSVNYQLEKEGRYIFYWDSDDQLWDLRKRR